MIRAVFFDLGGVLLQFADGVDHKALEARLGLAERTLMRCIYLESRAVDYQRGACTEEEMRESVTLAAVKLLGEEQAAEMIAAFEAAERPLNDDVIALVERLRAAGYRTGIISNTMPGFEDRLRKDVPHIIPMFDIRIGSGDLGVAKPDPAIYQHALRELDIAPEHAVFTDDVRSYSDAASAVGMHGFHFTGCEQFAADLRSIGVDA